MKSNLVNQLLGLENKTVLITGAASGIGRSTARLFASCGCVVWLMDIDFKGLAETMKEMTDPEKHRQFVADLGNKGSIDNFWDGESDECPDILVNNAGFYPTQDFLKLTAEEYQKTIEVNLNSMLWMCQQFINCRRNLGGVIVNIASIEAILPFKKDLIPYCVSKAGVIALTRSIARDYGKKGVRANVVLPGAIKTPGTRNQIVAGLSHLRFDLMQTAVDFQHRLALGRWGTPEEVAKVILFLASDLASYVQGAMLAVDGGFLST